MNCSFQVFTARADRVELELFGGDPLDRAAGVGPNGEQTCSGPYLKLLSDTESDQALSMSAWSRRPANPFE